MIFNLLDIYVLDDWVMDYGSLLFTTVKFSNFYVEFYMELNLQFVIHSLIYSFRPFL